MNGVTNGWSRRKWLLWVAIQCYLQLKVDVPTTYTRSKFIEKAPPPRTIYYGTSHIGRLCQWKSDVSAECGPNDIEQKLLKNSRFIYSGGSKWYKAILSLIVDPRWAHHASAVRPYALTRRDMTPSMSGIHTTSHLLSWTSGGGGHKQPILTGKVMQVPRCKTSNGQKAFCFRGPKAWNSVPFEFQSLGSNDLFRSKYSQYLYDKFALGECDDFPT